MISIEEAQRVVMGCVHPLPVEEVALLQGLGRVLGEDVAAPRDIPAADNSAMDGYVFSHGDLQGNRLVVAGMLAAGQQRSVPVAAGEALKILTGAPIPPGCDTVVPVEEVEEIGNTVRFVGEVRAGSHIRRQGEEMRAGDLAITAGTLLRPQEIGLLASFGRASVRVFGRPKVGVLATGDELQEPGTPLSPGRIINSNSYSVAAQVLEAGGEPVMLGIAADDRQDTRARLAAGLHTDLLVTTGGVSVGERDYVKEMIVDLGGEIRFWKVNMKPGKPVAFAIAGGIPVFALPGNPVAAMVAFEMFVRPALLWMTGHRRVFRPQVKAALCEPIRNRGDRPHLVRLRVEKQEERYLATSTGDQGSGRLTSLTAGHGFTIVAPEASLSAGDEVAVYLVDRSFESGEYRQDAH
jgi:molybdopterin molybdotransferase